MGAVAMRGIPARRGLFIMRAISVALLIVLGAAGADAAEVLANLVRNGDFEAGFKDGVAVGWKTWEDPWGVREYYVETADPHGGQHAQGWRNVKGSCSGVYQVVKGLTPGQAYRATMWTWYQTEGDMWVECGFDPAGGTEKPEVYWTKLETVGSAGHWLKYETLLVAKGEAVSLWFKWGTVTGTECKGLADDVSLVPVEEGQPDWGSASGRVWIAGGGPLPNAAITTRPGRRSARSGADGTFSVAEMYPYRYEFTATKPGYVPGTAETIEIAPGQPGQIDISLTPIDFVAGGDFESAFIEGVPSYWTPWGEGVSARMFSRSTEIRRGGDAAVAGAGPGQGDTRG